MQRLLLPMSASVRWMSRINRPLAKQQFTLGCSLVLCSVLSHAAIPLNDRELNNNFLQNDLSIPTLTLSQIQTPVVSAADPKAQLDSMEQRRQLATGVRDLVRETSLANVKVSLDKRERDLVLSGSSSLLGLDILNEIKTNELGSERYSYRWSGNMNRIYDLSQFNNLYFDQMTGDYELTGIKGFVEIEAYTFEGNEDSQRFRRAIRVF
jgi:hypothetical protein